MSLEDGKDEVHPAAAGPLSYAIVVSVKPESGERSEDFVRGFKIRALAGPHKNKRGEVVSPHPNRSGEVLVEFDDGARELFKVAPEPDGIQSAQSESGYATIALDGKLCEVLLPHSLGICTGDTVKVTNALQIVARSELELAGGIGFVRRVINTTFCEVEYESSTKVVFSGKFSGKLEKGDRVVLDRSGIIVLRNLGREDERFSFSQETDVSWDSIGGLEDAKLTLREIIELPHTEPTAYAFYHKKPISGVLFFGPAGCGKTMLGKAAATALARIYARRGGAPAPAGFLYIKAPEILDKWVGASEATIRQIFARAKKHYADHGYPAVIFIDEAEAILGKRGSGISSDMERTIVPMFLAEMDGLEKSGALVILATNRPDILDSAVVRDGRIDHKIRIGRPTRESTVQIFNLNLKDLPLKNGFTHDGLAHLGMEEIFAERRCLYQIQTKTGLRSFTLGNIVNGAMVAGVVDKATTLALRRDLANDGKLEGITQEDLVAAVDMVERENRDLNHTEELDEYCQDFSKDVLGIHRLAQARA